ncbi:DNA phosphorothioation-dependent restriction protein DptG [Sporomusa termitida]|uniref:DNA phosphorothioation-dependent restriction protein DptG n=1 Tax=Sporomusa termitida TaxID=2377 RepID=A0A517DWR7_9FIRM|nr:DNA phosphorothioation-dependent restriction protein DptG [Sporomusa termitida]QDR81800.1 DNA phosphorothioation-dependent restriction protein DptG [Sporomusa termitida]
MAYKIDFEGIHNSYNFNDEKRTLRHNTGKKITLFPYNTKFEKNRHKETIENYISVVGEFSRNLNNLAFEDLSLNEQWIDDIISHVNIDSRHKIILKGILKELFFNGDQIDLFHPKIFNYIKKDSAPNTINPNLAKFLFDTLLENYDTSLQKIIYNTYNHEPQNILATLLLKTLPPIPKFQEKEKKKKYKSCIPFISNLFCEDLNFMLNNSHFFLNSFDKLLKFYYFIYVAQLAMKLNRFLATDIAIPEPIYFNLEWESLSKSRTSYNRGWKLLAPNIHNIFSHANCLELLNHNFSNQSYTYAELRNKIYSMSQDEQSAFLDDLKKLKTKYIEHISDVNLEAFNVTQKFEDEIQNEIFELFNIIDYQFNVVRKSPYQRYALWFEEFCKTHFLKPRGSLGNTLNMSEENLIFITRLCIKDKSRLRLKLLFEEYEKRGVYFDRDSQNKIVQLFEKLNLIDKKSDSGDAQYVKAIL